MPYIISKQFSPAGQYAFLPKLEDTCIFRNGYDDLTGKYRSPQQRHIALLYQAVANRENYFIDNTPTAFGNPDHSHLCGIVDGICMVAGITETVSADKISFSKNGTVLLTVDIPATGRHELR